MVHPLFSKVLEKMQVSVLMKLMKIIVTVINMCSLIKLPCIFLNVSVAIHLM